MALTLLQSCATCCHFDGDCHCALPADDQVLSYIAQPSRAVCVQWERACTRCGEYVSDAASLCDDCESKAGDAQTQARLEP